MVERHAALDHPRLKASLAELLLVEDARKPAALVHQGLGIYLPDTS